MITFYSRVLSNSWHFFYSWTLFVCNFLLTHIHRGHNDSRDYRYLTLILAFTWWWSTSTLTLNLCRANIKKRDTISISKSLISVTIYVLLYILFIYGSYILSFRPWWPYIYIYIYVYSNMIRVFVYIDNEQKYHC